MSLHRPFPRPVLPNARSAYVAATMRLNDPSSDLVMRHVRILRDCVALAQQRWTFDIDAAVVLPNELQLMCSFAAGQSGIAGAFRFITTTFVRHAPTPCHLKPEDIWDDAIELVEVSAASAELRKDLIENEPVRAGLVKKAADWPFSSAHRRVAQAGKIGVSIA